MQHSTQIPFIKLNKKLKKNYTVLKFGKLDYCVNFFFFFWFCFVLFCFWDNQQINIKIKISSFFYVFIYLNKSIVKYRDFNFEI